MRTPTRAPTLPTWSPSPQLTLCLLTPPALTRSCPLTLTDLESSSLPDTNPKCPTWLVLDTGRGPSHHPAQCPTYGDRAAPLCGYSNPPNLACGFLATLLGHVTL